MAPLSKARVCMQHNMMIDGGAGINRPEFESRTFISALNNAVGEVRTRGLMIADSRFMCAVQPHTTLHGWSITSSSHSILFICERRFVVPGQLSSDL